MAGPFLLLITLGALVGLATIWSRALKRPSGEGARCGQCDYRVDGLETLSCPECGSDFRTVGIRTPQRVFIRPVAFVLLWTILLPWPALLVTQFVYAFVPTEGRVTSRIQFTVPGTTLPTIELLHVVRGTVPRGGGMSVTSAQITKSGGPTGQTCTLAPPTITGSMTPEVLGFELYELRQGATRPAVAPVQVGVTGGVCRAVDLDTIEPWLRTLANANAPTTGDPSATGGDPAAATAAAAELALVMNTLAAQGPPCVLTTVVPGQGQVVADSRAGFPAWIGYALGGFWLAVYAGGLILFLRIHGRRVAADETDAQTRGAVPS